MTQRINKILFIKLDTIMMTVEGVVQKRRFKQQSVKLGDLMLINLSIKYIITTL